MHTYAHILNFIEMYGYAAVFLGAFLEGETIVLISGLLVHQDILLFSPVLLFGFLGAVLGDTVWFLLGKYKGEKMLSRFPRLQKLSEKPSRYIMKKPALISFWVRFIYGFRHIIPFSLGMSGYSLRLFVFWNSLGALFWVLLFTSGGYLLGNILESFLGRLKHYQITIVIVVIIMIVLFNLIAKIFKVSVEKVVKE